MTPTSPSPETTDTAPAWKERLPAIGAAVGGVLVLGGLVTAIVLLVRADAATTARIRDIFIIFMALESLLIGLSLVVLVVQVARLINLLQNEIRPILENTQEAVNTLRGTTAFLSDNLVEPVIKLNGYLAGLSRLLKIIHPK